MSGFDSPVVVDTNVISLFIREDELADFYRDQIAGLRHLVSFQTVEELWYGAYSKGWGSRRKTELERLSWDTRIGFDTSRVISHFN